MVVGGISISGFPLDRISRFLEISPTTDKFKSTDKLKPEDITVFRYVKILRGCIVASLVKKLKIKLRQGVQPGALPAPVAALPRRR